MQGKLGMGCQIGWSEEPRHLAGQAPGLPTPPHSLPACRRW